MFVTFVCPLTIKQYLTKLFLPFGISTKNNLLKVRYAHLAFLGFVFLWYYSRVFRLADLKKNVRLVGDLSYLADSYSATQTFSTHRLK